MTPLSLIQTAAPTVKAVGLEEVLAHLRIDDHAHDDRLGAMLDAAIARAELLTGRQLLSASWTLKLDAFPADALYLRKPPLVSVTSVKYLDAGGVERTLSASTVYTYDTTTDPGRILLRYGQAWPSTYQIENAVTIVYVAGYGAAAAAVPEPLKQAVLQLCEAAFDRNDPLADRAEAALMNYRDWYHWGR